MLKSQDYDALLGIEHPRVPEGFATLPGVLTKSSKNRKMRHPGVYLRYTPGIPGVNGQKSSKNMGYEYQSRNTLKWLKPWPISANS
jgi:hypothetical protein